MNALVRDYIEVLGQPFIKLLHSNHVVGIISRLGLSIDVCHRNQPNKSKLLLLVGYK